MSNVFEASEKNEFKVICLSFKNDNCTKSYISV